MRWILAVAGVPTLAVLAWWYATHRLPMHDAAPAAEAPIAVSPAPAWADINRRQDADGRVLDLVRSLVESQKQTAAGLVTLRQDLQAVRGELQDMKDAAAARQPRARPKAVRKRPRTPTASAPAPAWRWW